MVVPFSDTRLSLNSGSKESNPKLGSKSDTNGIGVHLNGVAFGSDVEPDPVGECGEYPDVPDCRFGEW